MLKHPVTRMKLPTIPMFVLLSAHFSTCTTKAKSCEQFLTQPLTPSYRIDSFYFVQRMGTVSNSFRPKKNTTGP